MLEVVVDDEVVVVVVVLETAVVEVVDEDDVDVVDGGRYAGRVVGSPLLTDAPTDL